MLNKVTSENILNSEVWKLWGAERIVRLQFETAYPVVPHDVFVNACKIVFNTDQLPATVAEIIPNYREKFPIPLELKEILSWLPKSFYMTRIK
jgi:hypothetical protein